MGGGDISSMHMNEINRHHEIKNKLDSKSYPQLAKYIPRFSQTVPHTVLVNHLHMYKIHHTALFTLIIFDRWTHYLGVIFVDSHKKDHADWLAFRKHLKNYT